VPARASGLNRKIDKIIEISMQRRRHPVSCACAIWHSVPEINGGLDARASELPRYIANFHRVERDMLLVPETEIELPAGSSVGGLLRDPGEALRRELDRAGL